MFLIIHPKVAVHTRFVCSRLDVCPSDMELIASVREIDPSQIPEGAQMLEDGPEDNSQTYRTKGPLFIGCDGPLCTSTCA